MSTAPLQPGFRGVITALVTPMRAHAGRGNQPASIEIDEPALSRLVERQLAGGVSGLVACGTTGEAATMTPAEQARVIHVVVEAAARRVPVLAGVGSPSTAQSVELAKAALAAGAQGLLAVTPYYNRPSQEGLLLHFGELARLHAPIMLYNVPARTGCDLLPDTVARLCELPQVVSLKEATGQTQRTDQVIKRVGDRLTILSGEDAINFPLYCLGAEGAVSVVSNIAPRLTVDVWRAAEAGQLHHARMLHRRFLPLAEALFSEPNPVPAKTALAILAGDSQPPWAEATVRPPLTQMSETGAARLRTLLLELE